MTGQVLRNTREEVLECSAALFAKAGFHGVSMRDIASSAGVTPAALYHHFPDKERLYLEAVAYVFEKKMGPLKSVLDGVGNPWERLEAFLTQHAALLNSERDFLRLMQWVMLDSDERRQHSLADCVFRDLFAELGRLSAELAPGRDPHLLVVTLIGMVVFPFEVQPVQRFMPDYRGQLESPEAIARHAVNLLRHGIGVGAAD